MNFKSQSFPAIFLDRDGTINEEVGYLNHPSRLKILKGVPQALKKLQEAGFKLFIVTNQSGPARGYFPYELVDQIHNLIKKRLKKYGVEITEFLVCFHHPSENCHCRKPKTGLIEKALSFYSIDISKSYVIGDKCIDLELAQNVGMKGILVLTGYGKGELQYVLPQKNVKPYFIAKNLLEAANFILNEMSS